MSKLIFLTFLLFAAGGSSYAASIDDCLFLESCDECIAANCHWVQCSAFLPSCQWDGPSEFCNELSCTPTTTIPEPTTTVTPEPTTTVTPEPTTMTPEPTTTVTPEPTTTVIPDPTTTETPDPTTTVTPDPTTVTPEPTTAPTPEPTTIIPEPTTTIPTESPTTVTPEPTTDVPTTTAKPPAPSGRHFDAASFFGGIVLAIGILAVAYAAYRFYKSRNGRSYHTL